MILPVGVGFASSAPMGVVGFRIMTCWPARAACDGLLLGEEFRALVVADHVVERDGRVLIDDGAVVLEAHGRDARRVDDACDANFARQLEQLARAVDVGGVHLLGIANPQAVVRGNVDQSIASGQRRSQLLRLAQIADNGLGIETRKRIEAAGRAGQQTQLRARVGIAPRHMAAHEARRSCDEYTQFVLFPSRRSVTEIFAEES